MKNRMFLLVLSIFTAASANSGTLENDPTPSDSGDIVLSCSGTQVVEATHDGKVTPSESSSVAHTYRLGREYREVKINGYVMTRDMSSGSVKANHQPPIKNVWVFVRDYDLDINESDETTELVNGSNPQILKSVVSVSVSDQTIQVDDLETVEMRQQVAGKPQIFSRRYHLLISRKSGAFVEEAFEKSMDGESVLKTISGKCGSHPNSQ